MSPRARAWLTAYFVVVGGAMVWLGLAILAHF